MRISPLDIQSHQFRSTWRGLDAHEVESFLSAVAEDYAALLQELTSNNEETRRLGARMEELSLNEALLKETLVTAQNLGDELRSASQKEAEIRVSEAEIRAERILDAAHRRAGRLGEEIREMRGLRTRLASALRTTVETHLMMIEALSIDSEEYVVDAQLLDSEPGGDDPLSSGAGRWPGGNTRDP